MFKLNNLASQLHLSFIHKTSVTETKKTAQWNINTLIKIQKNDDSLSRNLKVDITDQCSHWLFSLTWYNLNPSSWLWLSQNWTPKTLFFLNFVPKATTIIWSKTCYLLFLWPFLSSRLTSDVCQEAKLILMISFSPITAKHF